MRCPIFESWRRLFVFHLGSVALGSFIITLIKIPRMILVFVHNRLVANPQRCVLSRISIIFVLFSLKNSQSILAKNNVKCCICWFTCLERCCRYLHHNAYTIIGKCKKPISQSSRRCKCEFLSKLIETLIGRVHVISGTVNKLCS